ncbi:MAG TPA: SDR family oxidoreductase [Polyangiaceae bacterium]|nr:SDR family oxidoreductase [Polyangiaceae bacterium]
MLSSKDADPREGGTKPPFPKQQQDAPGKEAEMHPQPDYGESSYVGHGRLQGKKALITGGDSGIGRAVALAFAREGADVAFSFVADAENQDSALTTSLIRDENRSALAIGVHLEEPRECQRLIEKTVAELGAIDILVNNAAVQEKSLDRFEDLTPERIERTFAVNVFAMFHLVRAALPTMKPGASVINTTSIQAFDPSPNILDYAVTKGAIVNFTKGLSRELIERGIRVNAVAPGPVWTPLIVQSFEPEKVAKFGESSPTGRPAQPAELAPAYVFLASNEARFITGEVLAVTGGRFTN